MGNTETKIARLERITYLKGSNNAMRTAKQNISRSESKFLSDVMDRNKEELKFLATKHEWLFNFEGGGWNSVHAYTKDLAINKAKREHGSKKSKVNENTFRIKTESDYKNLMSMFY